MQRSNRFITLFSWERFPRSSIIIAPLKPAHNTNHSTNNARSTYVWEKCTYTRVYIRICIEGPVKKTTVHPPVGLKHVSFAIMSYFPVAKKNLYTKVAPR